MYNNIIFWRTLLLFVLGALAQDVGFDLDGNIEGATTSNDTLFNSGGTVSVNGFTVTVPKNLQVGFPASWVPWKDFVNAWKNGKFPGFEISVSLSPTPYLPPSHVAFRRKVAAHLRVIFGVRRGLLSVY